MMTINKENGFPASPNAGRVPAGIYVHIPFCVRKCIYCDFNSYAGCSAETVNGYFSALEKEARLLKEIAERRTGGPGLSVPVRETCASLEKQLQEYAAEVLPADSLFIGGGTPSLADPHCIQRLLSILPLAAESEVTIEANPGTLTPEKLSVYRKAGVNRLSLGVQSFNDHELSFLGRIHNAEEALSSFQAARAAGFDNISLDLMFGFPGQTLLSWKETLRKAAELEPEHLSFYSLQIEEGTPLYRMFRNDEIEQLPDETDREMYHEAVRFLKDNDYRLYEISNAARRGRECRHNLKYWTMAPYFGIGAGAHSFLNGFRYASPEGIDAYSSLVEDLTAEGVYFEKRGDALCRNTPEDSMSDHMFTGLRLREGVDLGEFARRYQVDPEEKYRDAIQRHLMDGTMVMEQGRLKFTEKGIDLSSYILVDFI